MCLAIPAEIISIEGDSAQVSVGGVKKQVSLALVSDVAIGDYVLLHVGYALNRIDAEEAEKTLQLFNEMSLLDVQAGES